jgi:hypothetical protein
MDHCYDTYSTPSLLRHMADKQEACQKLLNERIKQAKAKPSARRDKRLRQLTRGHIDEYAKCLAMAEVLSARYAAPGESGGVAFNMLALDARQDR